MDLRAEFESTISKFPSISLRTIVNVWILGEWLQAKEHWLSRLFALWFLDFFHCMIYRFVYSP